MTDLQETISLGIAMWSAIVMFYVILCCVVKSKFISSYWTDWVILYVERTESCGLI